MSYFSAKAVNPACSSSAKLTVIRVDFFDFAAIQRPPIMRITIHQNDALGNSNVPKQDIIASKDVSLVVIQGEVSLKMPKLRRQTFETAIIERYRRREEASIEESLIKMYQAGVSVRRVEELAQALWVPR